MEKVINYLTGFFGGLMAVMMAIVPVTILWYVLTGGDVWGMDVITNLTSLINNFGTGGFTGLVVLILLSTFFVKKQINIYKIKGSFLAPFFYITIYFVLPLSL